jgi:hypothetical protein
VCSLGPRGKSWQGWYVVPEVKILVTRGSLDSECKLANKESWKKIMCIQNFILLFLIRVGYETVSAEQ